MTLTLATTDLEVGQNRRQSLHLLLVAVGVGAPEVVQEAALDVVVLRLDPLPGVVKPGNNTTPAAGRK